MMTHEEYCSARFGWKCTCDYVNESPAPACGAALSALIGRWGEFTSATGEIYQCVVRGIEGGYWIADALLIVDYVKPETGEKITGAYIAPKNFRQNAKLSHA